MENYEDDGPWMWVAFAPSCRLIVAFAICPRKQYVADELVKSTAKRLAGSKPLFVSDGLEFYVKSSSERVWRNRRVPKNWEERKTKETKTCSS